LVHFEADKWNISNINQLERVNYLVNDIFDVVEGQAFKENF
jgi:hypothetical protein